MLTVSVLWERMIWNGSKQFLFFFLRINFINIFFFSPLSTFITLIFFCYIQISQNLNFIILLVNVQVFHVYFLSLCFSYTLHPSSLSVERCTDTILYFYVLRWRSLNAEKTQIANAARKNESKTHRNFVWNCFTWAILTMQWYSNWMRSCVPKIMWTNNIWHNSNTIRPNQATCQRHKQQWQTFKFNIKIWMCR